jgi:hypothetical protein
VASNGTSLTISTTESGSSTATESDTADDGSASLGEGASDPYHLSSSVTIGSSGAYAYNSSRTDTATVLANDTTDDATDNDTATTSDTMVTSTVESGNLISGALTRTVTSHDTATVTGTDSDSDSGEDRRR